MFTLQRNQDLKSAAASLRVHPTACMQMIFSWTLSAVPQRAGGAVRTQNTKSVFFYYSTSQGPISHRQDCSVNARQKSHLQNKTPAGRQMSSDNISKKTDTCAHTVDWSVSCSLYDAVWKCFCCYGRFALKKKASIPKLSRAIWTRCRCADRLEQERRARECVCSRVDCATVGFTCSIIQLENNCSSTSPRLRHVWRIPKLVAPLHPKSELFEKCHLQSLVG